MRTGLIVANPRAAAGAVGRNWSRIEREVHACYGQLETVFTKAPGDATRIVSEATRDWAGLVVAVGGDGTINECVNGLTGTASSLGVFPAGTGGDLARSIGVTASAASCTERLVDVGHVSCVDRNGVPTQRSFINIASMGSSGLIIDKVNATTKRFGAKASFMLGTLKGLAQYKNQRVRITVDGKVQGELVANTVAVANARYFGGGMKVAPDARLDDGLLDVVVIGDIGMSFFVRYSGRLYAGTHTSMPEVKVFRGTSVVVEPLDGGPMLVETDGEHAGQGPATFTVLPKALRLLGRWDRAEA